MSTPVSLQVAIINQVIEFANSGQKFSVHNITTALRDGIKSGKLNIPEVMVNGSSRFDLPHSAVRQIFRSERANGRFDSVCRLDEDLINNMYFEYTPVLNTPTASQTSPVQAQTPINPTTTSYMPVVQVSANEVKSRVKSYLDNCATRQFRPTIEKVRCAIKRGNQSTGWTCSQLADLIENDLNFALVPDPDFVSKSQVIVD
jgi:hypothetical protein